MLFPKCLCVEISALIGHISCVIVTYLKHVIQTILGKAGKESQTLKDFQERKHMFNCV